MSRRSGMANGPEKESNPNDDKGKIEPKFWKAIASTLEAHLAIDLGQEKQAHLLAEETGHFSMIRFVSCAVAQPPYHNSTDRLTNPCL